MKKSVMKFALAALVALGFSATAAQAATGNWNGFATGPTIYQTNWLYESSTMSPPSATPTSAYVSSVSWTVKLNYYPSGTNGWIHFS